MSIQQLSPAGPPPDGLRPHRFSVEQYHHMIEKGILTKDDHVELIEGLILQMSHVGPPHRYTVEELFATLRSIVPAGWKVYPRRAITFADSEPEPDISIVRGTNADYKDRHPLASEAVLLIEVADSSLAFDRLLKSRVYAMAGVPEYWIVNMVERQIEVYRNPRPDQTVASYESRQVFSASEKVPFALAGQLLGEIAVERILP